MVRDLNLLAEGKWETTPEHFETANPKPPIARKLVVWDKGKSAGNPQFEVPLFRYITRQVQQVRKGFKGRKGLQGGKLAKGCELPHLQLCKCVAE